MNNINRNIFREYDIRGIADSDFTDDVVLNLGKAFGTYVIRDGCASISISGDVRLTTPRLKKKLIEGVLSTGIDVIDIGTLPTPVNYFSMFCLDIDGAIQITGSHNPKEYNGFKFSYKKTSFFGIQIQDLYRLIDDNDFEKGNGKLFHKDILSKYIDMLYSKININKPMNIIMDCGNAAGCITGPTSHKRLGINVLEIFCEIDGNFPNHHPDPTEDENLETLIKEVNNKSVDFGVAFDGDADRIVVVDENGEIIRSDILICLFINHLISDGDHVVYDVKCSKALEEVAKRNGGIPIMWKTGHSLIKQKMKELDVKLAGEMSGHIFFADDYYGYDDAIYVSLRLAELLSNTSKSLSELVSSIPKYFSTPEIRIECQSDEEKFRICRSVEKHCMERYDCINIDGVRIQYENGWGLVRASNTQPVIVCRFEANTIDELDLIRDEVVSIMKKFGNIHFEQ